MNNVFISGACRGGGGGGGWYCMAADLCSHFAFAHLQVAAYNQHHFILVTDKVKTGGISSLMVAKMHSEPLYRY